MWDARSKRLVGCSAAVGLAAAVVALVPAAVLGSPGDLDLGFGGTSHGRVTFAMGNVTGLAVQSDGKIVTVGSAPFGDVSHAAVARLNADGTLDDRFGLVTLPSAPNGADPNAVAQAVAVQPDGKLVVAGQVTDGGRKQDFAVWRLEPSGALDTSFGGGLVQFGGDTTDDVASAVALDPQGRIVIAGTTASADSPDLGVLRLTSSGALDATFNSGQSFFVPTHPGTDFARSVAVQSDGNIVVGGFYQGATGNAVVRLVPGSITTPAQLDDGFGDHGVADVAGTVASDDSDVAVTSDGHVLVLDQVVAAGGMSATVVRLGSAGAVDDTFGSPDGTGAHITTPAPRTTAKALTVLPGGGVAVVGSNDLGVPFVAKLGSTGMPDLGMGPGGVKTLVAGDDLVAVAALADGRIITAGNTGPHTRNVVYRLQGDLKLPTCAGKTATIVGTGAADTLVGTWKPDVIAGLGGPDTISGRGQGDIICGGAGNDHVMGRTGADQLYGGAGRDRLYGNQGDDELVGGPGQDQLVGGSGHDSIRP